jgi:hypothetical protein
MNDLEKWLRMIHAKMRNATAAELAAAFNLDADAGAADRHESEPPAEHFCAVHWPHEHRHDCLGCVVVELVEALEGVPLPAYARLTVSKARAAEAAHRAEPVVESER